MMVDARPATEVDMISALYMASKEGSVSTLNRLMQNPLILTDLSLTTKSETPLHISASLGHVDFSRTLLRGKSSLASEFNSLRRLPLHVASAEGHTQIVKELLQAYVDACLVPDQDERIPLHYAVMRGRADVVRELITAVPDSVKVLDRGVTVLHLCIKYNKLETLKVLVDFVGDNNEILNTRDRNTGNTILHLAVMLKQIENTKYLLSLPGIKEAVNTKNQMGFTALDILEHCPSDFRRHEFPCDFRSHEFRCLLKEAGIKSKKVIWWKKCLKNVNKLFRHEDDWLKETQGNLIVVASVISTACYQAAVQQPRNTSEGFMICNTISFVASLSVTFLFLSGLPLRNKFCVWLLSIAMLFNLIVLALGYLIGASASSYLLLYSSLITLMALIFLSLSFLTVRFFVWVGKKIYRSSKHKIKYLYCHLEMKLV